ncbi:hypothetical protein O988_07003 [Pseudogymnoascus sp. VKM F-3808]|nr:hypothetical protein O988_07003 [Pseudogymnoascus sp. VKM F-3808]
MEKDIAIQRPISDNGEQYTSKISAVRVGRENLSDTLPPHEDYEGRHRFDPGATWTPAEERRVILKTDLYLLSWICVMFAGLQLDRGNLSNATADNILDDLNLTSDDYNNGTTIQLLAFMVCEFPVQILTKRYGFKRILPTMMILWSLVTWAQSWMTNRTSFYITRALIGAFEGGFIPGTILFATYFYTSKELSIRLAAFWSTLNVARVISALLAAGILELRGTGGKPGWFWLFLIEGILTFVIGIISFFYLPSSPTSTAGVIWRKPWYTEREEIIMRILRDDPAKGLTALKEPATFADIKSAWSDKSMWGLYFVGLVAYIPATPVQAYLTLTLKRLNFSTFNSNMLTIPSAAIQIVTMLTLSYSSEFFNERTFHCFFGEFWSLPLLAALITLPDGGREWSRFSLITLISGYPYFHPIVSAWISENTFDVKKRAITAATYNVIVQVGSLIGSQIYRKYDSPYYKQGNKVLISICAVALLTFVAQRLYLQTLNKRKAAAWDEMTVAERSIYQADATAREVDGNKRLDFRFQPLFPTGNVANPQLCSRPLFWTPAFTPHVSMSKSRNCAITRSASFRTLNMQGTMRPAQWGSERSAGTPAMGARSARSNAQRFHHAKAALTQNVDDGGSFPDESSNIRTDVPTSSGLPTEHPTASEAPLKTPTQSLIVQLCVYRLRLYPIWPIVAVEEIMGSLQGDEQDTEIYSLANAIGAATVAQLKLDQTGISTATGKSMAEECQRTKLLDKNGQSANLNILRIAFFLHIYYENQDQGGVKSLLYLREAITIAQIMGLHRESSYISLPASEQQVRRRILWLLFVTERGVGILYKLPVILKPDVLLPAMDGDDEVHILPAFEKLVDLFWTFDQSRVFEILEGSNVGTFDTDDMELSRRNSLYTLHKKLQEVPLDWDSSNEVQRADICVTRQWMRAVLWKASNNYERLNSGSQIQMASLDHPIQIAREFLSLISQLPTTALEAHGPTMEAKIYEIASTVADAVANDDAVPWISPYRPMDILVQLQRILASIRGGNEALERMLYSKAACVQGNLVMLVEPSLLEEDLGDEWPGNNTPFSNDPCYINLGSISAGDTEAEMIMEGL